MIFGEDLKAIALKPPACRDDYEVYMVREELEQFPNFDDFGEPELKMNAARYMMYEECDADVTIFLQGENPDNAKYYFIVEGSVSASHRADVEEREFLVYKPGDSFNELSLLRDEPCLTTCVTTSPCVFLTIQKRHFREQLKAYYENLYRQRMEYLKSNVFFRNLSEHRRLLIAYWMKKLALKRSEVLFRESDVAESLFLLAQGEVALHADAGLRKDLWAVDRFVKLYDQATRDRRRLDTPKKQEKLLIAVMNRGELVGDEALINPLAAKEKTDQELLMEELGMKPGVAAPRGPRRKAGNQGLSAKPSKSGPSANAVGLGGTTKPGVDNPASGVVPAAAPPPSTLKYKKPRYFLSATALTETVAYKIPVVLLSVYMRQSALQNLTTFCTQRAFSHVRCKENMKSTREELIRSDCRAHMQKDLQVKELYETQREVGLCPSCALDFLSQQSFIAKAPDSTKPPNKVTVIDVAEEEKRAERRIHKTIPFYRIYPKSSQWAVPISSHLPGRKPPPRPLFSKITPPLSSKPLSDTARRISHHITGHGQPMSDLCEVKSPFRACSDQHILMYDFREPDKEPPNKDDHDDIITSPAPKIVDDVGCRHCQSCGVTIRIEDYEGINRSAVVYVDDDVFKGDDHCPDVAAFDGELSEFSFAGSAAAGLEMHDEVMSVQSNIHYVQETSARPSSSGSRPSSGRPSARRLTTVPLPGHAYEDPKAAVDGIRRVHRWAVDQGKVSSLSGAYSPLKGFASLPSHLSPIKTPTGTRRGESPIARPSSTLSYRTSTPDPLPTSTQSSPAFTQSPTTAPHTPTPGRAGYGDRTAGDGKGRIGRMSPHTRTEYQRATSSLGTRPRSPLRDIWNRPVSAERSSVGEGDSSIFSGVGTHGNILPALPYNAISPPPFKVPKHLRFAEHDIKIPLQEQDTQQKLEKIQRAETAAALDAARSYSLVSPPVVYKPAVCSSVRLEDRGMDSIHRKATLFLGLDYYGGRKSERDSESAGRSTWSKSGTAARAGSRGGRTLTAGASTMSVGAESDAWSHSIADSRMTRASSRGSLGEPRAVSPQRSEWSERGE
eukprot:Rmarinus@m.18279